MDSYFAPKGKEAFYFDTSAVNWLVKDPGSAAIANGICTYSGVYISAFTVAELAATPLKEQRNRLLKIAKSISSNWRPLAMPNDLLKRSLNAMLSKTGFSPPIRPESARLIRDAEVAEQDILYRESGDADSL